MHKDAKVSAGMKEWMAGRLDDVAQRMANAQTTFVDNVVEQFGFTPEQAIHILNVYREIGFVKYAAGIGRYELQHGAYWERDILENALDYKLKAKAEKKS